MSMEGLGTGVSMPANIQTMEAALRIAKASLTHHKKVLTLIKTLQENYQDGRCNSRRIEADSKQLKGKIADNPMDKTLERDIQRLAQVARRGTSKEVESSLNEVITDAEKLIQSDKNTIAQLKNIIEAVKRSSGQLPRTAVSETETPEKMDIVEAEPPVSRKRQREPENEPMERAAKRQKRGEGSELSVSEIEELKRTAIKSMEQEIKLRTAKYVRSIADAPHDQLFHTYESCLKKLALITSSGKLSVTKLACGA